MVRSGRWVGVRHLWKVGGDEMRPGLCEKRMGDAGE